MRTTTERTPTIDRELLAELRKELGDPAMAGLVELFSERAPMIRELVRVSAGPNGEELARLAHSLKGGASILAATRLAELAEELKERGRTGRLDGVHILACETAAEFNRALAEISDALGTP